MNLEEDSEYYPWRCPCGRLNKKHAAECAICYGPWHAGTRHRTQPKSYAWTEPKWEDWEDWEDEASWASSRSTSRSSTRYRQDATATHSNTNQQQPVKKGKGSKGKGKGKKGGKTSVLQTQSGQMDQPSPFQKEDGFVPGSQMDSAQFMPSTTLPSSPFASLTASSSTDKKEWIEHIKRAYPDPNTMPEDTKIFLEKTEQETGRTGIKSLHQATKYLGKVKKHLGDVTDQRRAHRNLWMNHLAKGIQLWEKQLADFRKHQALLTDQAGKARTEISAASRIIQQLSSATAGGLAPPTPLPPETEDLTDDPTDKEEEVLRKQLQGVLQNCASSLGLDFEPSRVIEIKEEDEKVEEDKRTKRQRSQEPSGVATKQQ